jgi:hypothetical protein
VVFRFDEALTDLATPVQCYMAEHRSERMGGGNDPHQSRSKGQGPHAAAHGAEKEERHERLQTIGSGARQTVQQTIDIGSTERVPETPVNGRRNGQEHTSS